MRHRGPAGPRAPAARRWGRVASGGLVAALAGAAAVWRAVPPALADAPAPLEPLAAAAILEDAARAAFGGRVEPALERLRPLAADPRTPEPTRSRAQFLLGTLLLRAGRAAEAAAPLEAAAGDPMVGDRALARLAAARRAGNDARGAARALARLLATHSSSPLADTAWGDLGRAAAEAGDLSAAEGALREALARARNGAARAETQVLLAETLLRSGRPAEAAPLLREAALVTPSARAADRALALLATLPGAPPLSEDERFQRALRLYRAGAYAKAARELAPFAEGPGPDAAQARITLGMARFHARKYHAAIATLEPLLGEAAGARRAEPLFWLARAHARLGDRGRFLALLEELVAAAPQHRRADDALFFLALGYQEEGRLDRAAETYSRLLREHPQSHRYEEALWGRGWLAFRRGAYDAAARDFLALAARSPGWRAQAGYWEGRALEAAGRGAEARRRYAEAAAGPDAYYATLARARAGGAPPPLAPAPPHAAAAAPQPRERLPVARTLAALWLADDAAEEYDWLVGEHPEDSGLVSEAVQAFLRLGRPDRALAVAKRILWPRFVQSGGVAPAPAFWEALYPRGYWDAVAEQGRARGLDPHLVLAVIREESAFAPNAVSPAGARGLMQLMHSTAARLAGANGLPAPGGGPPLEDPRYNIALGTAELADLVRQFQGDLAPALAAYNAGPQPVRRWIQERGRPGPEEFVEEIPFDETRNYVKRVLGSYHRYRALYAGSAAQGPPSKAQDRP